MNDEYDCHEKVWKIEINKINKRNERKKNKKPKITFEMIHAVLIHTWPELLLLSKNIHDDDAKREAAGDCIINKIDDKIQDSLFYCIAVVISKGNINERWDLFLFPFLITVKRKHNPINERLFSLLEYADPISDILSKSIDDLPSDDSRMLFSLIILSLLLNDATVNPDRIIACVRSRLNNAYEYNEDACYINPPSNNSSHEDIIIVSKITGLLLRVWNDSHDVSEVFSGGTGHDDIKNIIYNNVIQLLTSNDNKYMDINNFELLMEVCEAPHWLKLSGFTMNYCRGKTKTTGLTLSQTLRFSTRGGI